MREQNKTKNKAIRRCSVANKEKTKKIQIYIERVEQERTLELVAQQLRDVVGVAVLIPVDAQHSRARRHCVAEFVVETIEASQVAQRDATFVRLQAKYGSTKNNYNYETNTKQLQNNK